MNYFYFSSLFFVLFYILKFATINGSIAPHIFNSIPTKPNRELVLNRPISIIKIERILLAVLITQPHRMKLPQV